MKGWQDCILYWTNLHLPIEPHVGAVGALLLPVVSMPVRTSNEKYQPELYQVSLTLTDTDWNFAEI